MKQQQKPNSPAVVNQLPAEREYEAESVEIVNETHDVSVSNLNREEIDIQITTAKRYPRSITAFKRQVMEMATLDEETAASMFYVIPRGGKKIEGPSVRLAEVVGSAWGNLRYGARPGMVGPRYLHAQGVAFDLEKNIAATVEVTRKITDSHGRRYSDDMIGVTMNAACSIAVRQAIFKIVPFALLKDIYTKAKEVSLGKGMTFEQQRTKALEAFKKFGAKEPQVLKWIGRKGVEDITVDDLIDLRGIYTALQDKETTIEQLDGVEPTEAPETNGKSKSERLAEKLAEKKEGKQPETSEVAAQ